MSSCPQCSTQTAPGDRFCGDCGTLLTAQGPGESERSQEPSGASEGEVAQPELLEAKVPADSKPSSADAAPHAVEPLAEGASSAGEDNASAHVSFDAASVKAVPIAGSEARATGDAGGAANSPRGTGEQTAGAGETSEQGNAGGTKAGMSDGGASDRTGGGGRGTVGVPSEPEHPQPTVRDGSTGGRRAVAKPLEAGTLLHSRYEIVRRIGGGGMGAVYLAKDRNLGDAPRAVKEMIQSNIDESQHEKAVGDFRRESMLLSSLEHQSIPTIYDYFYDDGAGRFYLVMKYISGGDFLARLRNAPGGRLDEKTVADWGCQVADVLYYLHRQNPPIIYRDLKPANLMIDGNSGRVMLIDFGIARWVQKEEKGVTAVGTMGYAPPELFSGKVEPRSDIYSLGATMFHLLTGADPQDNPLLIFDFNKNPRPRQITPSLSNEMESILMRAVEYKPENRFRSAAEMRDVLSDHLERLRTGQVTYGMTPGTNVSANLKTMQVEMVYCGFCGGRIAADDVYCAHCGQRQPTAVASAALRHARATAKLVVMGTTELDSSFLLQKESSLVGRSDPHSNIFPEVDLSRFDPQTKVSRRHARIFRKGDTYLVEDLGSVNGTVVNDTLRLAPNQPRALESGDKLRLGETTLHFLIG